MHHGRSRTIGITVTLGFLCCVALTTAGPFSSAQIGGRVGGALISRPERAGLGLQDYHEWIGPGASFGAVGLFPVNLPIPGTFTWAPSVDAWLKIRTMDTEVAFEKKSFRHRFMEWSLNPLDLRYAFQTRANSPLAPFAGFGVAFNLFSGRWETQLPAAEVMIQTYRKNAVNPKIFSAGANLFGGATIEVHDNIKPCFDVRAKLGTPRVLRLSIGATIDLGGGEPETAAEDSFF